MKKYLRYNELEKGEQEATVQAVGHEIKGQCFECHDCHIKSLRLSQNQKETWQRFQLRHFNKP